MATKRGRHFQYVHFISKKLRDRKIRYLTQDCTPGASVETLSSLTQNPAWGDLITCHETLGRVIIWLDYTKLPFFYIKPN